uniref:DDE Tnp4 domain-containing protein n=1 Tax=Kryptolebias marmoratus TaxID=37003 RepID=A0A3Q3AGL2_KRYMA
MGTLKVVSHYIPLSPRIYRLDIMNMSHYKRQFLYQKLTALRGKSLLQVLITLRFLASGILHCETGDLCGASKATECIIVHRVCSAICDLRSLYIKFPDASEPANYKVWFYKYGHFPRVIGCMDGCHVAIKCPSTPNAEEYRNHKNWFSINVRVIFLNSSSCAQFDRGQHSGLILCDRGYGQSTYLFTPYLHSTTKNRFHCLQNTLNFKQRKCCSDYFYSCVPKAVPGNNQRGLAHKASFTLQHYS